MEVSDQLHTPSVLSLRKEPWYPWDKNTMMMKRRMRLEKSKSCSFGGTDGGEGCGGLSTCRINLIKDI
jgi:hypothetical protein